MGDLRFRIASITSADGQTVVLPQKGVTCIVGGNNVGKSRLIRDLHTKIHGSSSTYEEVVTISALDLHEDAYSKEELKSWIESKFERNEYNQYTSWGQTSRDWSALNMLAISGTGLSGWADYVVRRVGASESTSFASAEYSPHGGNWGPGRKLHLDGTITKKLSQLSLDYFGSGLTYDRVNLNPRLRFGLVDPSITVPLIDSPTPEHTAATLALPPLESQGDGVKAFMGIVLRLLTDPAQVFLFDEPETFLHPAQARALGGLVARIAQERDLQILMATHSKDLVLGILQETAGTEATFVRISRPEGKTRFATLDATGVDEAWSDPTLRYSNVLDGLFHQTVVVCEGDADCRFFSAALDEHAARLGRRYGASEVMFIPTGGKQNMQKPVSALRRLDVEVKVIADFDLVNERSEVRALVEAVGGIWGTEMHTNYGIFRGWLRNNISDWEVVKHGGTSVIRDNASTIAADAFLAELALLGIYILRVGEMEDFNRAVESKKAAPWVSAAIAANVHRDNRDVQDLMAQMFPWDAKE
ncbi:ATP-dependent endonuclease [Rathayibacter sp. AY1D1]|uniref:ATP-dependent nuclease n=1 Tax=Rathayibacter sp. AY1D1 TaxID=2080542 RepID=UPI0011B0C0CA|nr:AAA family ATPase [Rathayibacter sp. AY1D1]